MKIRLSFICSMLLAGSMLVGSQSVWATAPRIAPQLFGEEKKAEVVAYQLVARESANAESEMIVVLAKEAFLAGGQEPSMDMLPSRQLARYALFNRDAVALIGSFNDLNDKERRQYRILTFYLKGERASAERIVLVCAKKGARSDVLYKAFSHGLQQIIKNGKYGQVIEKYMGAGAVQADVEGQLKPFNPGWK